MSSNGHVSLRNSSNQSILGCAFVPANARIFDKYAGILMHFRLRDFTVWIPRFADHSTKTRIRTNRKKLFPKEIFIRFHKQNKNLETSSQKMDFNFVFTNREKGNGYKMMNTSVIFLLQIILIYNSQKRRS